MHFIELLLYFDGLLQAVNGAIVQIEFPYDRQRDLFIAFQCPREVSYR